MGEEPLPGGVEGGQADPDRRVAQPDPHHRGRHGQQNPDQGHQGDGRDRERPRRHRVHQARGEEGAEQDRGGQRRVQQADAGGGHALVREVQHHREQQPVRAEVHGGGDGEHLQPDRLGADPGEGLAEVVDHLRGRGALGPRPVASAHAQRREDRADVPQQMHERREHDRQSQQRTADGPGCHLDRGLAALVHRHGPRQLRHGHDLLEHGVGGAAQRRLPQTVQEGERGQQHRTGPSAQQHHDQCELNDRARDPGEQAQPAALDPVGEQTAGDETDDRAESLHQGDQPRRAEGLGDHEGDQREGEGADPGADVEQQVAEQPPQVLAVAVERGMAGRVRVVAVGHPLTAPPDIAVPPVRGVSCPAVCSSPRPGGRVLPSWVRIRRLGP